MSASGHEWAAARARLEAAAAASGAHALTPERAQHILRERARVLALPPAEAVLPGETTSLVVFRRGESAYGVDALGVAEVLGRVKTSPLPGSRALLTGVLHHRGRIVAAVDVQALIAPGSPAPEESRFIVVAAGAATLALLADEIRGVSTVRTDDVLAAGGRTGAAPSWVRGTTADMVTVLDVEGLLGDARLTIDEAGA
jgi:chemotaxis signal transduction protein